MATETRRVLSFEKLSRRLSAAVRVQCAEPGIFSWDRYDVVLEMATGHAIRMKRFSNRGEAETHAACLRLAILEVVRMSVQTPGEEDEDDDES